MIFSAVFSGCGEITGKNLYKVPSNDRSYYMGLINEKNGNISEARRLFTNSVKKSSSYIARRSAEKLTELGNVRDRLEACEALIKKYDDEDALLIASR